MTDTHKPLPAAPAGHPSASAGHGDAHGEHAPHVIPLKVYIGVWLALMVFTGITVASARINLGEFNIWLAMLIATVKATLVVLFFMHMAFEKLIYSVVLVISLLLVGLFIAVSAIDTGQYQHELNPAFPTKWDDAALEASTAHPK